MVVISLQPADFAKCCTSALEGYKGA